MSEQLGLFCASEAAAHIIVYWSGPEYIIMWSKKKKKKGEVGLPVQDLKWLGTYDIVSQEGKGSDGWKSGLKFNLLFDSSRVR